jgi:hypothetical protein
MINKIKQMIQDSPHKELPEYKIIRDLQTRSLNESIAREIDQAIDRGELKKRYINGQKYISIN